MPIETVPSTIIYTMHSFCAISYLLYVPRPVLTGSSFCKKAYVTICHALLHVPLCKLC